MSTRNVIISPKSFFLKATGKPSQKIVFPVLAIVIVAERNFPSETSTCIADNPFLAYIRKNITKK